MTEAGQWRLVMEFYPTLPVAPGTPPEKIDEPHDSKNAASLAGEKRRGSIIPNGGRINYWAITPPGNGEPIVVVERLGG